MTSKKKRQRDINPTRKLKDDIEESKRNLRTAQRSILNILTSIDRLSKSLDDMKREFDEGIGKCLSKVEGPKEDNGL